MIKSEAKRSAISGVFFLSLRRSLGQVIQTVSNIILARVLFPGDFGEFAIILFFINVFTLVSDLGLSASLVQYQGVPTKKELRTIFTSQLFLGILASFLMFEVITATRFNIHNVGLLQLSALSLIIFNLKLIPWSLLERHLQFKKVVVAELSELLVLEIVTVGLALNHFGVASFVYGLLAGRVTAALVYNFLRPWGMGLGFSLIDFQKYLKFGWHFQLNAVIGTANGAVGPIVVGGLVGTVGLGLVNWAGGVAAFPRIIGEIIAKIIFPLASRVQGKKQILGKIVEKSINITNLISFPIISAILVLAKPITVIIFTDKWLPGLPALYLFTIQSGLIAIGVILTNTLLALGKSKTVRNINLFWVILQWVLTIPLVYLMGFSGLALAGLLVSLTNFIPYIILRREIQFNSLTVSFKYLVFSLVAGGVGYGFEQANPAVNIFELLTYAFLIFLVYGFLVLKFRSLKLMTNISRS